MNTPIDYPPVSSYLAVGDAAKAIAFYQAAFGATELYHMKMGDKIGHCELMINGTHFMLADEFPGMNKSPATLGGTAVTFCLIVADADAAIEKAVAAGATLLRPAANQFYGFRSGSVRDPFGHEWMLQHILEKLSPAEIQQRMDPTQSS